MEGLIAVAKGERVNQERKESLALDHSPRTEITTIIRSLNRSTRSTRTRLEYTNCTHTTRSDTIRSTRNLGLSGATLYHDRNAYPPGLIDIPLPDSEQHMGKGSQLSQLKSALSQAGLSKQSQPGRKRKRAQTEEKDHAKRAARLREIQQKLNPFDVKVTKLKHDVGGRKLKGVSGKPAQSKQAGIEAVSRVRAVLPFVLLTFSSFV